MKARLHRTGRPAFGFTLIELLIAIAILGLLMTAAFGSLTLASRSWQSSISKADTNQDLRRSVDFVTRQFAHLMPMSRDADGERRILFEGRPDFARFVAPAPESLGGGYVVVTLAVEHQAADVDVWFSLARFDPGSPSGFDVRGTWQRPLLAELHDASISYYGAPSDRDEVAWRGTWEVDATRYPGAVRLAGATDNAQPLELFFRIKAEELL